MVMVTYIVPQGKADSIDRATLQYPCKIVDIENREEYYFMNAEGDKIVTADVSKDVDSVIPYNKLKDSAGILGVSASETAIDFVMLRYSGGSFEIIDVLKTVKLASPLSFTGIGFFIAGRGTVALLQHRENEIIEVGQHDPLIIKAIDEIGALFGFIQSDLYQHLCIVSERGYEIADFRHDEGELIGIDRRGTLVQGPSLEGFENEKVLTMKKYDDTIMDITGTKRNHVVYAWKHPKVGDSDVTFE